MTEPDWSLTEGTGWVRGTMDRYGVMARPSPRVLGESRSVHIHYWTSDDEMDDQGWGMADLTCHGCGHALRLLYPAMTMEQATAEPFRVTRDAFVHDHRQHVALLNAFLCPPVYFIHETRDLR